MKLIPIIVCFVLGLGLTACRHPKEKGSPVLVNNKSAAVNTRKKVQDYPYAITYGSPTAPHQLVSFFDMGCDHCADFYRDHFLTIQKKWIDTGKLCLTFKPYPVHGETLVFMACCEVLTAIERQLLFETLMEVKVFSAEVIQKCMRVLKKPFQMPTAAVLKEALVITKIHKFEALPVMFFDGEPLNDTQQDTIMNFLEETLT